MTQRAAPDARANRPPGLIDTLQAGFNVLNHNIWLLSIPIAVDLLFWLGPQVSIATLINNWLRLTPLPPGLDVETVRALEEARAELVRQADAFRQVSLLSLLTVSGLPSFRAVDPPTGPTIVISSWGTLVAVASSCLVLGIALTTLLYGMLAQAVRDGRAQLSSFMADFGRLFLRVTALGALFVLAVLGVGLPLLALLGLVYMSSPVLTGVIVPVLLGILLWFYVYLFFTTDALFVSKVAPGVAIQHSIAIVRYNFWSALGLIVLLMIISQGFLRLSLVVAGSFGGPGVALAIAAHIYISTGLAAASMTYYKERFARLGYG